MRQSLVAVAFALCATPSSSFSVGSLRAPFAPQSSSSSSSPALVPARFGAVFMQEEGGGGGADGGERERSRGRTAVVSRPKPKPKQDRKEDVDIDKSWRVLLHNDDVRLTNTPTAPPDRCCGISHSRALTSHTPFASLAVQVHTFDYVTMAIVKVVKTITRKKAHRITVQCHSMGTATVTTTWKQMAKQMCLKLQKFGLTSSIAPDGS